MSSELLCHRSPQNEEYTSGSLVDDVGVLMDISTSVGSNAHETLMKRLGVEKIDDECQFRAKVQELYIENRGIALQGLRDGLSLRKIYFAESTDCVSHQIF
jgi:hypothetical protein